MKTAFVLLSFSLFSICHAQNLRKISICNPTDSGIKAPNLNLRFKVDKKENSVLIDDYISDKGKITLRYESRLTQEKITVDGFYNDIKLQPNNCVNFNLRLAVDSVREDTIEIYYDNQKLHVFRQEDLRSFFQKEFNGSITYKISVDYKGNNPNLNVYRKQIGDTLKIYFGNNKYYMKFQGAHQTDIWYDNETGKQYCIQDKKDTLYIDDAGKNLAQSEKAVKENKTENILGRKCRSFRIKSDKNETVYFYDPQLYVNPKRYDRHAFGFVNLYYQNCQAPYLKSIRTSQNFTYTYTAVKIDTAKSDERIFEVPQGLPHSSLMR